FFYLQHQQLYDYAAALIRAGKVATPVTLKTWFGEVDCDGLNGNEYMARLVAEGTTIVNAGDYGRVVFDLSRRRGLIPIAEQVADAAYNAPVDDTPETQIEDAERALFGLAETSKYGTGFQSFSQVLAKTLDMVAKAREQGGFAGLATGLTDLDNYMGGLQPRDFLILACRPGM